MIMSDYDVRISSAAQNDFLEISERLKMLTPEEAAIHYDSIEKKAQVLVKAPDSCPSARDSQLRLRGYRMLTIDDYIYFFVVSEKTVYIRRVLYSKRQYERLM